MEPCLRQGPLTYPAEAARRVHGDHFSWRTLHHHGAQIDDLVATLDEAIGEVAAELQ